MVERRVSNSTTLGPAHFLLASYEWHLVSARGKQKRKRKSQHPPPCVSVCTVTVRPAAFQSITSTEKPVPSHAQHTQARLSRVQLPSCRSVGAAPGSDKALAAAFCSPPRRNVPRGKKGGVEKRCFFFFQTAFSTSPPI